MTQNLHMNEHRGRLAYLSGLSAEDAVARAYCAQGCRVVARRWRGPGGEIDLIVRAGDLLVFVEVKKSRSFAAAALRISAQQKARIFCAAEDFAATQPDGLLSQMRFDVALVDATGQFEIIENALCTD